MKKTKLLENIIELFWIFTLGCFAGFIIETALVIYEGHYEVRKGLIYGPFIPVYGIGMLAYHIILSNIKLEKLNKITKIFIVFIITAILGGITEYICSFLQEKLFGIISWNYSERRFNLDGRTSLFHSTCWGILGVLYYLLVIPIVKKLRYLEKKKAIKIVSAVCILLMAYNILISMWAVHRQFERRNNIQAKNEIDIYLDEKYPDDYLKAIFIHAEERN